ncbi:MAG: TolB-like 6-bladed beta-propeller domain-containing protein, partial [Tannerella sp.]|nr:TolB-like 6-bladed beta-propeller domain-containing protein [Tannerella sp.]
MKKCIYFIFSIFILCNACKKQNEDINYFSDVKKITEYDSIYSDKDNEVVGIIGLHKYQNTLIADNRTTDYLFSFYDIEKGVYLGSWGKRGQGPDDFLDAGGVAIVDSQLVFTDRMKKEIIYVSIESVLNQEENINVRRESYPYTAKFRPFHFSIMNNKKIALGIFEKGRFGVLDTENNIMDCPSDYPFNYEEISGIYRGLAFQGKINSNIEQSKFVISTFCSDIFEIYQITDAGIVRTYLSPFNHIPEIRETPGRNSGYDIDRNKSIGGLVNMAVTNDLIYFVYTAKNDMEYYNSGRLSNEILCFDWDGKKIKKYILPIPVIASSFCVDNEYIYG